MEAETNYKYILDHMATYWEVKRVEGTALNIEANWWL